VIMFYCNSHRRRRHDPAPFSV